MSKLVQVLTVFVLALLVFELAQAADLVDFARDIQPIFEARCNSCHGSDEQEGNLRLDARAIVFHGGVSGPAVVKGDAKKSLLYERIIGDAEGDRMPVDDEPLSAKQIELIRRWIDEGARWPDGVGFDLKPPKKHWAYVKPSRAELPTVSHPAWAKQAIDYFVLDRLDTEKLAPSSRAEKARLLRRVYLDLVGLPPSLDEVQEFLVDESPDAFERVVDRLLASPMYGTKWARAWLDLARYADSNGYQADQYRNVWPYRDWVINAMNADMPFDQFTIEQLAGDLLPNATVDQKIATGFHRLTTCNVEAGVDPEENRTNQIIDRVNTTGTVWLGTSIECMQCHEHKYDPFSQKEYYQLFAFFNNTPLEVEGNGVTYNFTGPKMDLPLSAEQQAKREKLQTQIADLNKQLNNTIDARKIDQAKWEKQVAAAQKQLDAVKPTTTLVMIEQNKPRMTTVFKRGDFLNKGQHVKPNTPRVLHASTDEMAPNRLGFARWLMDTDNPLVGRVTINRWWAEMFGKGIVSTIEDFGTQGEAPTHPRVLDYLARQFADNGWSMKRVHHTIVTSAMYQQSSNLSDELRTRDPNNNLYARGPRFRLSAEIIRDNALAISGLFSPTMSGPPIYPPQPDGLWRHVGRNAPKYMTSTGNNRFRRGIYVVWQRSAPYPSFTNFDAPDRASCVVNRPRTNTATQALTLLNDPACIEMAGNFAARMAADQSNLTIREKVQYGFRMAVSRAPNASEVEHLEEVYMREHERFRTSLNSAKQLLGTLSRPKIDASEHAAWLFIANILLNLDESITKG